MYRLFGFPFPAHCYKLRQLLSRLGQSFETVSIYIRAGEARAVIR